MGWWRPSPRCVTEVLDAPITGSPKSLYVRKSSSVNAPSRLGRVVQFYSALVSNTPTPA